MRLTIAFTVTTGNVPVLTITPIPLVIPILSESGVISEATIMGHEMDPSNTVTASDTEDGDLTGRISHSAGSISKNTSSITRMTYSVMDSDKNEVSKSRAIIINDGNYEYNTAYILKANSFVIGKSKVSASDKAVCINPAMTGYGKTTPVIGVSGTENKKWDDARDI